MRHDDLVSRVTGLFLTSVVNAGTFMFSLRMSNIKRLSKTTLRSSSVSMFRSLSLLVYDGS